MGNWSKRSHLLLRRSRLADESAMVSGGDGECGGRLVGGVGQCARNILNGDEMVDPEVQE